MKLVNKSLKTRNKEFDKEHHTLLNVQGAGDKIVDTEAGPLKFEQNFAVLPNDGMANEVAAELTERSDHPDRVKIIRRDRHNMDRTHRYFFGGWPEAPWKNN